MRLSTVIADHFQRVAQLHTPVVAATPLRPAKDLPEKEHLLLEEMSNGFERISELVPELARPRPLAVSSGKPKGSWAHVYYVSFHDPINSTGPLEGFYPVFLLSTDHKRLWLVLMLAAASVKITGRGGWSREKGERLRGRSSFLWSHASNGGTWNPGPIPLGDGGTFLHKTSGNTMAMARAYECGVIAGRGYDISDLPSDLGDQLCELWRAFDRVFQHEEDYVDTAVPNLSDRDLRDQLNARITGERAEKVAEGWLRENRAKWGRLKSQTDRVGLGYDLEFPEVGFCVEVKGCVADMEPIRMTQCEWEVAEEKSDSYFLCLVTNLDDPARQAVQILRNPYKLLQGLATEQRRLQITYSVPLADVDLPWES